MLFFLFIILLSVILFFIIIPKILLLLSNRDYIKLLNDYINTEIKKPFFSYNYKFNQNKKIDNNHLIFVPHPFTNWSLNPNYISKKGFYEHTLEGFKKTIKNDSLIEFIDKNKNLYKIICIGGSSTHCQEMPSYHLTWPSLLNKKLNESNLSSKVLVINFGVGAWNTLQSYIRCLTWFPIINPDLVIFYQAKNDLTPIQNGNIDENSIMPDYQNVMTQYSTIFNKEISNFLLKIPLFKYFFYKKFFDKKFLQYGLNSIYYKINDKGLYRIEEKIIKSIRDRHLSIVKLCNYYDSKVLYVPEIVIDETYSINLKNIFINLKPKIIKEENAIWFDAYDIMKKNKEFFLDKMHFTEQGNDFFSSLLTEKIIKTFLKKNLN